ncbi:MAG: RHS repeat-associated core domain-containing protein, partial [Anaerolineae bacterium]|nr:RHS repeat-associated core domain-containing protein [Anaerolineae bacterium]
MATEYFAYDGLGSVRQVVDETGSPLLTQTFDPYGSLYARAGIAETAWGFTGEYVGTNGLLYLRARYYAPGQGRFFQLDPLHGVMT